MPESYKAPTDDLVSAFAPLRHRVFLILWLATLIGNTGQWMRDTASAWLMTELAPSPTMVALIQAAATAPIFLLSLPAGALADIVDRRRLMLGVQAALAMLSLALGILTLAGLMQPGLLLLLTLVAGVGNALAGPVWQAVVPDLVPRPELKPAVTLNGLGINLARAIGPALGGVVIVSAGVAAAYLLDVATYIVTIAALLWWKGTKPQIATPEQLSGAMRAGVRYALRSPPLIRVLVRAALFFAPASCFWALLPLIARNEFRGGAGGYGLLLGAVGAGAIVGAILLPKLRRRLPGELLTLSATLGVALATAGLAIATSLLQGALLLALAGAGWITMLTSLNGTAQGVLPNWVRARGLAVYLSVFFGTMTVGSVAWGQIASLASLDAALYAAGGIALLTALGAWFLPLPPTDADLSASHHWPQPLLVDGVAPAGGPVMIQIEYRVAPEDHPKFAAEARQLRLLRLRDGAYDWGLMTDAAEPSRLIEWFLVGSWEEHLRQHDRVSNEDARLQARVRTLHASEAPPKAHHLVPLGSIVPRDVHHHLASPEKA